MAVFVSDAELAIDHLVGIGMLHCQIRTGHEDVTLGAVGFAEWEIGADLQVLCMDCSSRPSCAAAYFVTDVTINPGAS